MKEEIMELFQEIYEGEELEFTEDLSIMDDLEISSLEFFSLTTTIEERFGVKITERELQNIVTIGDVIELVERKK